MIQGYFSFNWNQQWWIYIQVFTKILEQVNFVDPNN